MRPNIGEVIGYVVMTWPANLAGGWKDDWDGVVHTTKSDGIAALKEAAQACGIDNVALTECTVVGLMAEPPK